MAVPAAILIVSGPETNLSYLSFRENAVHLSFWGLSGCVFEGTSEQLQCFSSPLKFWGVTIVGVSGGLSYFTELCAYCSWWHEFIEFMSSWVHCSVCVLRVLHMCFPMKFLPNPLKLGAGKFNHWTHICTCRRWREGLRPKQVVLKPIFLKTWRHLFLMEINLL